MSKPKKKVIIIGAGISGMTAAIDLASQGFDVELFEKNSSHGGRGRLFQEAGFKYDMGPSWYWMPDIFEGFFKKHKKSLSQYFELIRLDPSYRIFFEKEVVDSPADFIKTTEIFEQKEKGSSVWLKKFIKEAQVKYELGMKEFVRKPSLSFLEYFSPKILTQALKLQLFNSIEKVIDRNIKDQSLRSWLKFPVLFLGAKPKDTPALYSLMNYADFVLGTWYPKGGMIKLFDAFYSLAIEKGVKIHFNSEVIGINTEKNKAHSIQLINSSKKIEADYIVSSADYHHTETRILEQKDQQYSSTYWDNRQLAPSALIFYLGVNERIPNLLHHNLFFDADFEYHAIEIYDTLSWPKEPLFYVCTPSVTDQSVAPAGHENLFILVPISSGIKDDKNEQERIYNQIIDRIESRCNFKFKDNIIYKKSYCVKNFQEDYYSFKGNAYGLSNVLSQTAWMKPKIKHNILQNLYFIGQLTHPGPGLPPSMISGEIAAHLITKDAFKK